jgi:hypothetical protein
LRLTTGWHLRRVCGAPVLSVVAAEHDTDTDTDTDADAEAAAGFSAAPDAADDPGCVEVSADPKTRRGAGGRSGERCRPYGRLADGPGLPDRVIKRLLCSGRIRTARHDRDGSLLDLGRSHRVVTPHLFRALLLRDGGCAHPGCGRRHGLEAHHVRHWLHGGRTDLANLVVLCRAHHHAHHDNELIIIPLGRGRFRFLRADGRELPDHLSPPEHTDTTTPIEDEHPDLAPDAATTRWDGTHLDHDYAITGLAQRLTKPTLAPA